MYRLLPSSGLRGKSMLVMQTAKDGEMPLVPGDHVTGCEEGRLNGRGLLSERGTRRN